MTFIYTKHFTAFIPMYDKEVHKNHEKTALLLKKFITFVPIKHIYSVNITFYNHNANKAAISLRRDPHTSVWGGYHSTIHKTGYVQDNSFII